VVSTSDAPAPEYVAHYRLLERIAVGGMAEVYRASIPQTAGAERSVVVKRMLPRIASDRSARAMFAEEARLGSHIRHPNVVQVLDYGEQNDNNAYLVLEFVQGVDLWRLSRFLTRTGRQLSVTEAIYLAREMLAGLHAVHESVDERGASRREPLERAAVDLRRGQAGRSGHRAHATAREVSEHLGG
jgi:serine/threonine protein kinase